MRHRTSRGSLPVLLGPLFRGAPPVSRHRNVTQRAPASYSALSKPTSESPSLHQVHGALTIRSSGRAGGSFLCNHPLRPARRLAQALDRSNCSSSRATFRQSSSSIRCLLQSLVFGLRHCSSVCGHCALPLGIPAQGWRSDRSAGHMFVVPVAAPRQRRTGHLPASFV